MDLFDRAAERDESGKPLAERMRPRRLEDFVGADRALKRLSLLRVADIDLWQAPLAHVGQATAEVRAKLGGAEVPHALVVDPDRRPLGWLSDRDLAGDTVPAHPDTSPEPVLELDDVMRDALSDLLQAESLYAPVVDGGCYPGGCVPLSTCACTADAACPDPAWSCNAASGHCWREA